MPATVYRMPTIGTGTVLDPLRPKYGRSTETFFVRPGNAEMVVRILPEDPASQTAAKADIAVTELKTDAAIAAVKTEWGI